MATVDHHKEIPPVAVRPDSSGGEMQTVHPSPAVVVNVKRVEVVSGQPGGSESAKRADVFVMVAGDKVVSKVANFHLSGQEQLLR